MIGSLVPLSSSNIVIDMKPPTLSVSPFDTKQGQLKSPAHAQYAEDLRLVQLAVDARLINSNDRERVCLKYQPLRNLPTAITT
jgi:hypothetical protein